MLGAIIAILLKSENVKIKVRKFIKETLSRLPARQTRALVDAFEFHEE